MFKAEVGLTLKMKTGGGFNFFRPTIGIEGIDPNGDVDSQIAKEIDGIKRAWPVLESTMVDIIDESELVDKESILVEIRKEMNSFNNRLATVENIKKNLKET